MDFYQRILNSFRLYREKEDYAVVVDNVTKGIVFRGTNLWILIFAIFLASSGIALSPIYSDSTDIVYMKFSRIPPKNERKQLENWLKAKFNKNIKAIFSK